MKGSQARWIRIGDRAASRGRRELWIDFLGNVTVHDDEVVKTSSFRVFYNQDEHISCQRQTNHHDTLLGMQ